MSILPVTKEESTSKYEMEMVENEKQEYKLIGSFIRTKGLRLFVYNPRTGDITEVLPESKKTLEIGVDSLNGNFQQIKGAKQERADIDTRNIPFEALNLKNAKKRVEKYESGKIKDLFNLLRCKSV